MDFEEMLARWEASQRADYSAALEGRDDEEEPSAKPRSRAHLKRIAPQRSLDLHGYTAEEAGKSVTAFLKQAAVDGIDKVLIVHGKGYHSHRGVPILRKVVYECLDSSPFAGERGIPDRTLGGSGAVWVIIKQEKKK